MARAPWRMDSTTVRARSGRLLRAIGIVVFLLTSVTTKVMLVTVVHEYRFWPALAWSLSMVLAILTFRVGLSRSSSARVSTESVRETILYLRSFRDDERDTFSFKHPINTSDEEELFEALQPIGQMETLARPDTILLPGGAIRKRASDWQAHVRETLDRSRLVLIRAGFTKGLQWEISQCLERLDPLKVVILVSLSPREYRRFVAHHALRFHQGLPPLDAVLRWPRTRVAGYILFGEDWKAEFCEMHSRPFRAILRRPVASATWYALSPIYRRCGVAWRALPINPFAVAMAPLIGFVSLVLFLMMIGTRGACAAWRWLPTQCRCGVLRQYCRFRRLTSRMRR